MQQYIGENYKENTQWEKKQLILPKIIYHFKVAKNKTIVMPQKINLS